MQKYWQLYRNSQIMSDFNSFILLFFKDFAVSIIPKIAPPHTISFFSCDSTKVSMVKNWKPNVNEFM